MVKKYLTGRFVAYFITYIIVGSIFLFMATSVAAQEMTNVIEGAKKEGKLLYYTAIPLQPDTQLMVEAFKKKYPFLEVEMFRLNGEQLLTKVLAEAKANVLKADVFQASIIQISQMKQNGLLMKYIAPESKVYGPTFKDPEGFWNTTFIIPYVIAYNTKLISKEEAPKSYEDLLTPKFKRKIGIDTEEVQWYHHLLKIMGREKGIPFMKALAKQDLLFRKGHTLLMTLCAAGEIPIVTVAYLDQFLKMKNLGASIEWVRFESSPTIAAINTIAIQKNAPHPNAAKLFYNFSISDDGISVLKKIHKNAATPKELSAELKGIDIYVAHPEELLANYSQVTKEWKEIFNLK